MQPVTRYAKSGDVHIAYQVFGEGPLNLVLAPPFVSNIENYWDEPDFSRWLLRLASYARVVMLDKRGTGMSNRVSELPGLDERIDDLRAVMDAAGMEQAALLGMSEGGPLTALFAATYPERCRALVLYGTFARFASWLPTEEALAEFLGYIDQAWGTGGSLPLFAPTRANDPSFQRWWGRFERLGASPAAASALMRMNSQIDISGILPTIRVPTLVIHRTEDVTINVEGGRYLAEHIPGARYLELPGTDHIPFVGDNAGEIADAIEEFLTGARAPVTVDRVLATVLFTDIVGSTEKAAALGDRRWRDLLDNHHATIRRNLARFRGHEIKTTGDGILATFDGPARGVRCACAIADEIRPLGIEVRAGLHTGECEMIDDDVGGIAVHIGARVASLAGAGEVLVSSTVKDLVAGSGLRFGDRGSRSLKGVPGEWRIFAVER
ncbi:MAG: adenylate/guanylate cyclase domain-containing protein [Xanthobacteraceae bacterium]|jgi:pimeloyl-ACP methyl ester carboxylesterase